MKMKRTQGRRDGQSVGEETLALSPRKGCDEAQRETCQSSLGASKHGTISCVLKLASQGEWSYPPEGIMGGAGRIKYAVPFRGPPHF